MIDKGVPMLTEFSLLLSEEISLGSSLLDVLGHEREALTHEDPTEIERIAEQKQIIMEKLREQLVLRDRFLVGRGYSTGKIGTDKLLNNSDRKSASVANEQWEQLQQLAEELQISNDINGTMVTMATRQVRQALEILTGRTDQQQTYGPGGQQVIGNTAQALAKA